MARLRLSGVAAFALALWPVCARACVECSQSLSQDPGARGFARGIYYSIIFIFAILGVLLTFVIRTLVKEIRDDAPGKL